jgi:hypothetical protein
LIHTVAFELLCFLHVKRTFRARELRFWQKHGWKHTTECLGSEVRTIRRGISNSRDRIRDWSKSAWYSLRLPKWSRQNQLTCDNCFHCIVPSAWGELAEGEVSHARYVAENSCRKHKLTLHRLHSIAPSFCSYIAGQWQLQCRGGSHLLKFRSLGFSRTFNPARPSAGSPPSYRVGPALKGQGCHGQSQVIKRCKWTKWTRLACGKRI